MKEIKIVAQTEGDKKSAEVLIYDVIGMDFWSGGGVTAKGFADRLDELGPLDEITVRINSPGGDVFDGAAIYNALVRNDARVIVEIDGLAASAASYIAMAGDEIHIAENGTMMIHQAQGGCMGDCGDMRKTADILEKLDGTIADIYSKRTNRKSTTWAKMMAEETWFNAEEAVAARLADSITPNKKAMAANFALEVMNKISKRPDRIAALASVCSTIAADDFNRAPEEETTIEPDDDEVTSPLDRVRIEPHLLGATDDLVDVLIDGNYKRTCTKERAEEIKAEIEKRTAADLQARLATYNARAAEVKA